MSLTDINKWSVGETDIFLAPQVVFGKNADCNLRQWIRAVSHQSGDPQLGAGIAMQYFRDHEEK